MLGGIEGWRFSTNEGEALGGIEGWRSSTNEGEAIGGDLTILGAIL
ncbi:hypothetical protein LH935_05940 [Gordonia polyisoprenivorans]|nr:hypothetical protein LH935_05940 [Gordonia polyisoprenivorans]